MHIILASGHLLGFARIATALPLWFLHLPLNEGHFYSLFDKLMYIMYTCSIFLTDALRPPHCSWLSPPSGAWTLLISIKSIYDSNSLHQTHPPALSPPLLLSPSLSLFISFSLLQSLSVILTPSNSLHQTRSIKLAPSYSYWSYRNGCPVSCCVLLPVAHWTLLNYIVLEKIKLVLFITYL